MRNEEKKCGIYIKRLLRNNIDAYTKIRKALTENYHYKSGKAFSNQKYVI